MELTRLSVASLGLLLLLCAVSNVSSHPTFFSSMLNHPKNPYNVLHAILSSMFPSEDTTYLFWRSPRKTECAKVKTVRARGELHWLFNDPNLDGVMDNSDVLWDIVNYNGDTGDMCNIEPEEALDHVACVYSYPRDFGTHYAQSLLDANADGRITWSEFVGVPINFTKTAFLQFDYTFFKDWCESNSYSGADCDLLKKEPVPEFML